MQIKSYSQILGNVGNLAKMRTQMLDLDRQLGTLKRSDTYGGLGTGRSASLSMRAEISRIQGNEQTIKTVATRIDLGIKVLDRISGLAAGTRSDTTNRQLAEDGGSTRIVQGNARQRLDEMVTLLNTEINGRQLFSGSATEQVPVESVNTLMNGDGARAGFVELMDERRVADVGTGMGRLATAVTGSTVTLDEETTEYGMKVVSIIEPAPSSVAVSGTTAPITVDFGLPLPVEDDVFRVKLKMPDATEKEVTLTATAATPPPAGSFTIGADQNETATNFHGALTAAIQKVASTDLVSASAYAAANDFFTTDGSAPRRVGAGGAAATASVAGTPANTVAWYKGESGAGSARETVQARVDDGVSVRYGMRANETPIASIMGTLAVIGAMDFSANGPGETGQYSAMTARAAQRLDTRGDPETVANMGAELAVANQAMERAQARFTERRAIAQDLVSDVEDVDKAEVIVQIQELQNRLEASYNVTSMLSQLSLVNYLK